jgi:PAS domain S-box-containing protein
MKNNEKTQKQLLKELTQLRRRIAELEAAGYKRNQFEEALRVERDKAQHYLDVAEVILVVLNKKGEITLINRKGNQILGYKEEELLGKNWFTTCVPSSHRKKLKSGFLQLMAGEIKLTEFYENPVLTKFGTERIIAWHNALLKDAQGNNIGTLSSGEDITGLKQAEAALKQKTEESELQYRRTLNSMGDAIHVIDKKLRFVLFNDAFKRWNEELGLETNVIGRTVAEVFPFLSKKIGDEYRHVLKTGQPLITEENTKINGRQYITETRKIPIFEGSKVTRIATIIHNITEREQAEEALRESEEHYKTLFNEATAGICLADAETGIIIDCNEALAALVCRERAELIGKPQKILHPPQYKKEAFSRTFKQHLTNKEGQVLETQVVTKTADIREVEIKANFLYLQGRKVLQGFFHDITERKQAEKALLESEEKYRDLVENINDVILATDRHGNLTYISPAIKFITGYAPSEVIGRPVSDLVFSEDYAYIMEMFWRDISGHGEPYEFRIVTKSGKIGWLRISNTPLFKDRHFIGLRGTMTDITQRKQAEEQIRRALSETRVRFEVSQALVDKETENEVLDALIEHAGLYPQSSVAILTFDRTEAEPTVILRRQDPFESDLPTIISIGTRFSASSYPIMKISSTNGLFVSADVMADKRIDPATREILHQAGAASLTFFPLRIGKEWEGLIIAAAKTSNFFDEEKQHLFQTLAEQGAVALRAARLREQVSDTQQRFQGLVETLSDWIWEVDGNGIYTYVSPRVRELLGYEPEEVLGKTPFDLMLPEEAERVKGFFASLVAAQQPIVALENTNRHKDGRLLVFETSGAPFFNVEGQFMGYRGVDRDITERKRAEEALRESEDRYRSLYENSEGAILLTAPDGSILKANPAACRMFGRTEAEIIQVGRNGVVDQTDPRLLDALEERKRTGRFRAELTFRRGDGQSFPAEVTSAVFRDQDGQLRSSMIIRDITEQKRLQETLDKERQELKLILDSTPIRVFFKDKEGKYIRVNKTYAEGLKKPEDDIVGKTVFDLYSPQIAQSMTNDDQEVLQSGRPKLNILEQYESASGIRWVLTDKVPTFDKEDNTIGLIGFAQDITERKRSEKEREWLANFPRFNPMPIVEVDQNGRLTYANPATQRLLPDIEKRQRDHPFLAELESYFVNLTKKRERYNMREVEVNGRWYSQVITLSDPEHIRIYAIDITERKKTDEALRQSEERYRTILENTEEGYYELDLAGNLIFFNDSVCQIYGYPREELMGMNYRQYMDQETAKNAFRAYNQVYRTGEPGRLFDYPLIRKDKTMRYVEASILLQKDFSGNPIGFRGIVRDITVRKQAEKALRESEEKYRDMVENISDIIYATGESGIVTYISPTIESISGYTPPEIVGRSFLEFVYQEDMADAVQFFHQDISGQAVPHEYRMLTKAGDFRWVRLSSRPVFEGDRVIGLRGILTDITARRQAEEAVKRSYEQLQETFHSTVTALASAVEMKDQYTAGHQPRVTQLACAIAEEMGLSSEQIEGIRMAASIHDIGKIMVPAEILNKPGPLTEIQYEMIKMHPRASYDILKRIKFPWPVAQIVLQHHERQDGSGYPQGLRGEHIMMEARILAVANVVEAMNAHRPYRPAFDIKVALEEISKNRGILYDSEVVDACLRLFNEKGFTLDPVSR